MAAEASLNALTAFWDRYAFSIGETDFQQGDAILAAMVRGEWPAFERRLAEGVACTARANASPVEGLDEAVEKAATPFRYERDLISGADVDDWLERAGISAADWTAFLTRDVLRGHWRSDLDDILDTFAPAARDLVAAAVAEGTCSGAFDSFARTLARRAAVVFDADHARFAAACRRDADWTASRAAALQMIHLHADWLSSRPRAETISRLARIQAIEASLAELSERLMSNQRLLTLLEESRLDWIELELDIISFSSAAAAREAVYCLTEDGLALADVAELSHQPVRRQTALVDELAPEWRDAILGVDTHAVVGPLAVDGRFDVACLLSRTAATLANPRVAARARQAAFDAALDQAAQLHVTHRARG